MNPNQRTGKRGQRACRAIRPTAARAGLRFAHFFTLVNHPARIPSADAVRCWHWLFLSDTIAVKLRTGWRGRLEQTPDRSEFSALVGHKGGVGYWSEPGFGNDACVSSSSRWFVWSGTTVQTLATFARLGQSLIRVADLMNLSGSDYNRRSTSPGVAP